MAEPRKDDTIKSVQVEALVSPSSFCPLPSSYPPVLGGDGCGKPHHASRWLLPSPSPHLYLCLA